MTISETLYSNSFIVPPCLIDMQHETIRRVKQSSFHVEVFPLSSDLSETIVKEAVPALYSDLAYVLPICQLLTGTGMTSKGIKEYVQRTRLC